MKAKWSVLAVYEDAGARDLVVEFCDSLVERFWSNARIDLRWCDWAGLEAVGSANEAEATAREADLIIVAASPRGIMPLHVTSWLELAVLGRRDREGVLVCLPQPETESCAEVAPMHGYCRKLAHRAGMDYLSAVPECLNTEASESMEAYSERARQVTSVLDGILTYSPQPPQIM